MTTITRTRTAFVLLLLVVATSTGCSVYTPRTIPNSLIQPTKQYAGEVTFVKIVFAEGLKARCLSSPPPVPAGSKHMTSPVTPFFRSTLSDSITNTLEASKLFNKVGSTRYVMKATLKRFDIYGCLRADEFDMDVQYELVDLQSGELVFSDLINSHTTQEFIFVGAVRAPKAMETVILDNVTRLVKSLHDHLHVEE